MSVRHENLSSERVAEGVRLRGTEAWSAEYDRLIRTVVADGRVTLWYGNFDMVLPPAAARAVAADLIAAAEAAELGGCDALDDQAAQSIRDISAAPRGES